MVDLCALVSCCAQRTELRKDACVDEDPALAPILRVPRTCWELHPGLCRSRDVGIFHEALSLAGVIHARVKSLEAGSFVAFHTYQYSKPFCLCTTRLRDPAVAIFAQCSFAVAAESVRLEINAGELCFETSYSIARSLTMSSHVIKYEIVMTEFTVQSSEDSPFEASILRRQHHVLREGWKPGVGGAGGHDGGGGDNGPDDGQDGGHSRPHAAPVPNLLDILVEAAQRQQHRRRGLVEGGLRPEVFALDGPGDAAVVDEIGFVDDHDVEDDGFCPDLDEEDLLQPQLHAPVLDAPAVPLDGPPPLPPPLDPPDLHGPAAGEGLGVPAGGEGGGELAADNAGPVVPVDGPELVPPAPPHASGEAGGEGAAAGGDEAAAHVPRERRAGKDGCPRLWLPGHHAYIRLSDNADGAQDMRAVCEVCKATFSRTCRGPHERAKEGSVTYGQGRPFGKVWSWAQHGLRLGALHTTEQHQGFKPTLQQRQEGRLEGSLHPEAGLWLLAERDRNRCDLLDGEPERMP